MSDSTSTQAERAAQSKFRIKSAAAPIVLLVSILLFDRLLTLVPNREELGWRTVELRFESVDFGPADVGPFQLAGAWQTTGDDPRIGGVSALAVDGRHLLALTDAGAWIRFTPPSGPVGKAVVGDLPDGPGSGRFKRNRDSEALLRDPLGRGWWVAFENRHELWLYDLQFGRALQRIGLGPDRWRPNKGVEGLLADGSQLLLLPEAGDRILQLRGGEVLEYPIDGAGGRIADAAALRPGVAIAVERRLTPLGFVNQLVLLRRDRANFRFGARIRLPLGPLDNVEAIAVQLLANGGTRLWLMTDDNFQRPMRTLLVALDWPVAGPRRQP